MNPPARNYPRPNPFTFLPALFFLFTLPSTGPSQELLDSVDGLLSAQYSAYKNNEAGFLNDALASAKAALETARNRYGPTHLAIVPVLTDLATLDRVLARFEEAESNLKWGLAIREKKLGPQDPLVAESLEQLAALYDDWGKWKEAEFFGKRALDIREKFTDQGGLVKALGLLGGIELNLRNNTAAQTLLKRGLELQDKNAGPPVLSIQMLSSLAIAFLADKRPAEALASLQKALSLAQKNFPAEGVEWEDAMKKLGDYYASTGQPEKAKPLYESVLKIAKGYVGVYYGYTVLPYLQRLAEAYQSVGDYKSAEDLLNKSLATSREAFGTQHPLVAVTLLRLARAEEGLGESKSARTHREEALSILKSRLPKDYPLILEVTTQLGK